MMRTVLSVVLVWAAAGCSGEAEPEHFDRPLSEWVSQATGKDPSLRLKAYDALAAFPHEKAAITTLEAVAHGDTAPPAERIAAAKSLYRATGDAERVLGSVRAAIRKEADSGGGFHSTKPVEDLVFWLGPRARPLVPDLQYAQGKIPGRDAASVMRRQAVQKAIDAIPPE